MNIYKNINPSLLEIVVNEDLKELEEDIKNPKYSYEGKMSRIRKIDMIVFGSSIDHVAPSSKEYFQKKLKYLKSIVRNEKTSKGAI